MCNGMLDLCEALLMTREHDAVVKTDDGAGCPAQEAAVGWHQVPPAGGSRPSPAYRGPRIYVLSGPLSAVAAEGAQGAAKVSDRAPKRPNCQGNHIERHAASTASLPAEARTCTAAGPTALPGAVTRRPCCKTRLGRRPFAISDSTTTTAIRAGAAKHPFFVPRAVPCCPAGEAEHLCRYPHDPSAQ